MTNIIKTFTCPSGEQIRVFIRNNEPWFLGTEIAQLLGYAKPRNAVYTHVDKEDVNLLKFKDSPKTGLSLKTNELQNGASSLWQGNDFKEKILINESGLYSLILASKLPSAKDFKRWVTSEVLPSIRKHGAYMTPETLYRCMLDPKNLSMVFNRLAEEQEARIRAEKELEEAQDKIIFHDSVTRSVNSISIDQLAKLISQNGIETGQMRLFEWMREHGYLGRKGTFKNMPMQRYIEQGLFEVEEHVGIDARGRTRTSRSPRVTGKGQAYFVKQFMCDPENNDNNTNSNQLSIEI